MYFDIGEFLLRFDEVGRRRRWRPAAAGEGGVLGELTCVARGRQRLGADDGSGTVDIAEVY